MINSKKNAFTLVELLAVIAVLGLILIIAIPKVMETLTTQKKRTLELTTRSIIKAAEEKYLENDAYGLDDEITCDGITNITSSEFSSCDIEFDSNGNATVTLNGKGRYEDLACKGTKEGVTCQKGPILNGLNCTFNGELVEGAEFTHNQYTYRYKQEYVYDIEYGVTEWRDIEQDGWGVILKDKTSTAPVNTPICSYINGKPVVSTSSMFYEYEKDDDEEIITKASNIDVSSWNTKNVFNMASMFTSVSVNKIYGFEKLDMSNVRNISDMFSFSMIEEIDLSNKNLDKVTNIRDIFLETSATSIKLNNVNISSVEDMSSLFENNTAEIIEMSNVDARGVTNISNMFKGSKAKTINLSGINFQSVTDMTYMFENSLAETINLSNMNASSVTSMYNMFRLSKKNYIIDMSGVDARNVTNMGCMFCGVGLMNMDFSKKREINLTNMNTSSLTNMGAMFEMARTDKIYLDGINTVNVTNMSRMFYDTDIKEVDLSVIDTSNVINMSQMLSLTSISDMDVSKFNTSKVTNMSQMFESSSPKLLDLSNFDISSANISNMFSYCNAGAAYAKTQNDADKFNDSTVTGIPETVRFIVKTAS